MLPPENKKQLLALFFVLIALVLLTMQSNPPFFLLFPMLVLTFGISWYLYKEIKLDNEDALQQSIKYMKEEEDAQKWLKKSFVPKARRLARSEMRTIIFACGVVLISFVFLWSYFVSGLTAALTNVPIALLFFLGFITYTLYAPKEFTRLFRYIPKRFSHHRKNDWVHAYLLLFPFAAIVFFLYSLTTTGEGLVRSFFGTIIFLFSYTLLFICLYCLWFLYGEYQKEIEDKLKKEAKKWLKES